MRDAEPWLCWLVRIRRRWRLWDWLTSMPNDLDMWREVRAANSADAMRQTFGSAAEVARSAFWHRVPDEYTAVIACHWPASRWKYEESRRREAKSR